MCSLSWVQKDQALIICFNRDELKTRGRAISPQIISTSACDVIMPKDLDGGGTWLAVNQFGVFVGLLNLYLKSETGSKKCLGVNQETEIAGEDKIKRSRGLLVKELSSCSNLASFVAALNRQDLTVYPSFELAFISSADKCRFVWDAGSLARQPLEPFSSSSSYQPKAIVAVRKQKFQQLITKNKEKSKKKSKEKMKEMLINLHSEHSTQKDETSICMHRDDACTVSMSLIEIDQSKIEYQYWDGSPCESSNLTRKKILTKSINN